MLLRIVPGARPCVGFDMVSMTGSKIKLAFSGIGCLVISFDMHKYQSYFSYHIES